MSNDKRDRIYDLEERTARFGEAIIEFAKKVPKNVVTVPLIDQLVKAGTIVGSNYCEADCAESKKDFEHKIRYLQKRIKGVKALAENDCKGSSRIKRRSQSSLERGRRASVNIYSYC
jgi:hypothetical protein